jgi:phosphatidylinositol glycan class A protein
MTTTDGQMAKKSIRLIPGLGWFMLMSGAVFIDRSNNKSAIASMTQAGDDMKQKNVSSLLFRLSHEPANM